MPTEVAEDSKKLRSYVGQELYLGIDPGLNGAAVAVTSRGKVLNVIDFSKVTIVDIAKEFFMMADRIQFASLEKVHAMPGQGVSSTFKFGQAYGTVRALLTAYSIKFEEVTPNKWMTKMQCQTKGDKRVTKEAAQRLFPEHKWTHKTSDAVLIAEYCRRTYG